MYNTIKLEKGLYNIASKSFTQALESLDNDSNYENTELKGLDAFERQLKRFDIKVFGAESDMVEKFFQTTESAVLFPEFVRRCIKQGVEEASIIPYVTAAQTTVTSVDYRGVNITSSGADTAISEGGELPVTSVTLSSTITPLVKLGRKISTSYEAIRQQRLDLFAATLRTIGAQISRAVNNCAVEALTASVMPTSIEGETLTYNDLVSFWGEFYDYNLTTLLVSPSVMADILKLDEMKNCVGDYMTSGTVKTPFGATLVKCTAVGSGYLIGLDKSCALEMINASDIVVDFEKLISTQMEDVAFTITTGFTKIIPEATKTLSL